MEVDEMGSPHTPNSLKPAKGESDSRRQVGPASPILSPLSPIREDWPQKRIPDGIILGEILLESCKAYPIHLWDGLDVSPRIAYADLNTHQEYNKLGVKLLPRGGKTAPHPQVVLYVNGPYHVETLGYNVSDPFKWSTWMELHFEARALKGLIDLLIKTELKLEGIP